MSLRVAVAAMALAFVLGVVAGIFAPRELTEPLLAIAREAVEEIYTPNLLELTLRIFLNNTRVVLLIALLGFTVVAPGLMVFMNGAILGVVMNFVVQHISWSMALLAILPHGVIEIPVFLYSAAVSTTFWVAVWRKLFKGKGESWRKLLKSFAKALAITIALLAVAAFVEVFITPLLLYIAGGF